MTRTWAGMQSSASATAVRKFAHVAPSGAREPFTDADNALIAEAQTRGEDSVRISDVHLSSGATLRFEVRFGAATRTERMPAGSATGISQVNLDTGNTRIVEAFGGTEPEPEPAPEAVDTAAPIDSAGPPAPPAGGAPAPPPASAPAAPSTGDSDAGMPEGLSKMEQMKW